MRNSPILYKIKFVFIQYDYERERERYGNTGCGVFNQGVQN